MPQSLMNWTRRLLRASWAASAALIPRVAQNATPADNTGSIAVIIILIAILGPIVLGLGIAVVARLISLGTPPAAVGAEPPKPARPREVIPAGVHLPPPSSRPLIIAIGITVMSFGLILRGIAIPIGPGFEIPIILVLGLLILVWGLVGWIRDDWRAARH